jgi:hypothetical protein
MRYLCYSFQRHLPRLSDHHPIRFLTNTSGLATLAFLLVFYINTWLGADDLAVAFRTMAGITFAWFLFAIALYTWEKKIRRRSLDWTPSKQDVPCCNAYLQVVFISIEGTSIRVRRVHQPFHFHTILFFQL